MMSDSASNKTDMPLPKLTQSQIADAGKQPTLGDISAIQSEIKSSKSTSQYVGNTQEVATPSVNDVLGDITLLEEAFAEMEVSVADYEQEIPMLRSTIEQPSSISQVETEAVEASNQSIPVLDQPPTEFVEAPKSANDSIHIGTNPDLDLNSESDSNIPILEENTSKVEEPASELTVSSVISIPESTDSVPAAQEETVDEVRNTQDSSEIDIDQPPSHHSLIESNSEPMANDVENTDELKISSSASELPNESPELSVVHTDPSQMETPENDVMQSEISDKEISEQELSALVEEDSASLTSQFSEPNTANDDESVPPDSISIEEKIANATGDAEPSAPDPSLDNIAEQLSTELAPSIIEDVVESHITSPGDDVNMSIPFELHAQLSKKIDALVLDATLSLTSELQNQLSLQLESLLCGAVEAVLPRLVDQMVNELRAEVKGRVQQQLPIIVNEVLGKTRLS